jgi:hypothetical protein
LVLSVDSEKKRISFGLKPSYFFDEDLRDESQETADEAEELDDEMVHDADQRDDEMPDIDDDSVDEEVSPRVSNLPEKLIHPKDISCTREAEHNFRHDEWCRGVGSRTYA